MVVCRAPRTETTSPEHALPESSSKVGALMVLAPASSKRGWLLRKAGALLSTQPHSEANGRASQLASEQGQADRHDNVFVYGPATVRCKEMSKKKKKKKSRWVLAQFPNHDGLLCARSQGVRPLMHRAPK